jgi:hypothetical protein
MRYLVLGDSWLVDKASRRATLIGESQITNNQRPITNHASGASHGH